MPTVSDEDVESIDGSFWPPDIQLFRVLLEATGEVLGGGDLAEFGVLHGRSAVLVGDYRAADEVFTVVDLFGVAAADIENRQENEEYYAGFHREVFEANYRRFHATAPQVVQGPSVSIAEHARHGTHRFVHVDASHLYEHVAKDIDVARQLLLTDGVLVLDDYRSEHTPGVAAAAWQAVLSVGLRPFAVSPHKMYATWGDPAPWADAIHRWASVQAHPVETQQVNGAPLLRVMAVDAPDPRHRFKRYLPEVLWPAAKSVRMGGAAVRRGVRRPAG